MRILYLDLFFLLNLLTDYLICLSSARICFLKLRRKRYLAAALFGSGYAVVSILPGFCFLFSLWGVLAAAVGMGIIAFGAEDHVLRCILTLLLVASSFGGAIYAFIMTMDGKTSLSLPRLIAFFLFCYGLLKLLSHFRRRWDGSKMAEVRLQFLGRETSFSALVDNGNSVCCPSTGEAVLIASPSALRPLFAEYTVLLDELQPVDLLQAMAFIPSFAGRLRLIPFHSLGGSGMLPVFRPEKLWINGVETGNLLVAVSREAKGAGFDAIL